MAAQRSEGYKRQRKRKQFYEEIADIGVTVQVQYYNDLSTAVRDFQKFRIHRYLPEEALSEPQNSMSGRQRLELDEALKEKMVWAFKMVWPLLLLQSVELVPIKIYTNNRLLYNPW